MDGAMEGDFVGFFFCPLSLWGILFAKFSARLLLAISCFLTYKGVLALGGLLYLYFAIYIPLSLLLGFLRRS